MPQMEEEGKTEVMFLFSAKIIINMQTFLDITTTYMLEASKKRWRQVNVESKRDIQ